MTAHAAGSLSKKCCALLAVAFAISLLQGDGARADARSYKVMTVKYSGWATRTFSSIRQTINAGDYLAPGDVLEVKQGNYVQLALEGDEKNIIHVQGTSRIEITENGVPDIQLSDGKLYALLDNLNPMKGFQITTPTAVSSVRGTAFMARTNGALSELVAYEGVLRVSGRSAEGRALPGHVLLHAAHRTRIESAGEAPSEPEYITRAEYEEINRIIQTLAGAKKELDYDLAVKASELSEVRGNLGAFDSEPGKKRTKKSGSIVY